MAAESEEEYSDFESEELDEDDSNGSEELNNDDLENKEFIPESKLIPISDEEEGSEDEDNGTFSRPEVRLTKLKKENVNIDFNSSKINKIKCLALCKILHGQCHWKVAEAHLDLANVYLKGKYYPLQTLKHSGLARDILLEAEDNESSSMQYLLQNLYYVMGRANLQLNKYKESENCLRKAKLVADNCQNATSKYYTMKVTILSSLATTLIKVGHLGQATERIEEGIEVINKMTGDNSKCLHIKLCKQLAELELSNGKHANFSSAEESINTALKISLDINGKDSAETADIYILRSRIDAQKEIPDFTKIEQNIQEALDIYKNIESIEKLFSSQQMLCKVKMQQGKFEDAKNFLDKCIKECEIIKGDMSLLSAELYELMGSILFAQNKMSNALVYFMKAEEIYKAKKKYLKKQEKIVKIIEIIRKSSKDDNIKTSADKMKERPRFY